jgi:hypothetical protein
MGIDNVVRSAEVDFRSSIGDENEECNTYLWSIGFGNINARKKNQ